MPWSVVQLSSDLRQPSPGTRHKRRSFQKVPSFNPFALWNRQAAPDVPCPNAWPTTPMTMTRWPLVSTSRFCSRE